MRANTTWLVDAPKENLQEHAKYHWAVDIGRLLLRLQALRVYHLVQYLNWYRLLAYTILP